MARHSRRHGVAGQESALLKRQRLQAQGGRLSCAFVGLAKAVVFGVDIEQVYTTV
jgi:hypothetical protein